MSRYTRWLAGIVVAAAGLSASAEITVPPGFVVDTLLDQIDGTTPRLEAVRNLDYGFGVVAGSVDNGILTIRRISQGSVVLLGSMSGFTSDDVVRTVRFGTTGFFDQDLFVSVSGYNFTTDSHFIRVASTGVLTQEATFGNAATNSLMCIFDFTTSDHGYLEGAYLFDGDGNHGSSLWHMDAAFQGTILAQDTVPPGRTDLDLWGVEVDPTGTYGFYLTVADCDINTDNRCAIYQLLPDLSWVPLTTPVTTQTRCYKDLAISPGGSFDQLIYVTDSVTDTVMSVDPNGVHSSFASGFADVLSVTVSDDGEHMFVSDSNGVYRIRAETTQVGPALVMREPWVEADDVHTGPSGVNSLRLLWSERVLFDNADVSITNEDAEPVAFSVSGSNSQFMIIAFGEVMLNDEYTITIHDSVVSAETGAAIDGDNDGLAGGDAVLTMEHRNRIDQDNDNDVDLSDLAALLSIYGATY